MKANQLSLELPAAMPRLPSDLRPMLATPSDEPFDDPAWLFEPSWDGLRVLAHVEGGHLRLIDPRGRDMTAAFPDLLPTIDAISDLPAIVDAEIVVPDENGMPDPDALRARVRPERSSRRGRRPAATLLVIDLLYRAGRSLLREPLARRRRMLGEALTPAEHLVAVPAVPADGVTLFEAVEAQGLPAILARRADAPYLPGVRSDLWRHISTRRRFDAVVGGYDPRADGVVSLLVGAWEQRVGEAERLVAIAAVQARGATPLAEGLERALRRHEDPVTPFARGVRAGYRWVRPELVVTLEHHGWAEGRLIDPTLVAIRDELDARGCRLPDDSARRRGQRGGSATAGSSGPLGRPVLALLQRLPLGE